ncbi:hypothetical protein [Acinetobacter modestus]|uniref:hypothetical protein n=1 Tax=Acinetobacter modestus TaxID=1776740 RepID=UPI001F4AE912|nr:hypothetical protein [Acinetobacter modestus]MCH7330231.1 hypothetical protein [Acinetobacter modestus]
MALQTMNQSLGKLYKAYYDKIPFSDYDLPKNGKFKYNNIGLPKTVFSSQIIAINNFFDER